MGLGKRNVGSVEYALLFYSIASFVVGIGLIAVGMWMNIDLNVRAYLIVFRRFPEDDLLMAGTACFIVCGLIMCGVSACAILSIFRTQPSLILIFLGASFLILIIEWTIGFMIIKFRHDIHRRVKDGMKEQLANHYMWDNEVGHAWNRVQVRKKCCGADNSQDYIGSEWWLSENPDVDPSDPNQARYNVPNSCCVLEYEQDREPGRVDPQDPRPKDEERCNEDAAGVKDGSSYLHGRGCFARMIDFVGDYYWSIMALSLIVGTAQIASLIIGWTAYSKMVNEDGDVPKRETRHLTSALSVPPPQAAKQEF